jgi:hypothetical protein
MVLEKVSMVAMGLEQLVVGINPSPMLAMNSEMVAE